MTIESSGTKRYFAGHDEKAEHSKGNKRLKTKEDRTPLMMQLPTALPALVSSPQEIPESARMASAFSSALASKSIEVKGSSDKINPNSQSLSSLITGMQRSIISHLENVQGLSFLSSLLSEAEAKIKAKKYFLEAKILFLGNNFEEAVPLFQNVLSLKVKDIKLNFYANFFLSKVCASSNPPKTELYKVAINKAFELADNVIFKGFIFVEIALRLILEQKWDEAIRIISEGVSLKDQIPEVQGLLYYHYAYCLCMKESINNLTVVINFFRDAINCFNNPFKYSDEYFFAFHDYKYITAMSRVKLVGCLMLRNLEEDYKEVKINCLHALLEERLPFLTQLDLMKRLNYLFSKEISVLLTPCPTDLPLILPSIQSVSEQLRSSSQMTLQGIGRTLQTIQQLGSPSEEVAKSSASAKTPLS